MRTLQEYLQMIENLGRNIRNGQGAPHKPCLLLAIIQLIEQGDIFENKIRLSNHLKDAFARYVAQIPGRWNPRNILDPFYRLKNEGFWYLNPNAGYARQLDNLMRSNRIPSSPRQFHRLVDYAYFDEPLFIFLTQPDNREIVRQAIIERYFPDNRQPVEDVVKTEHEIGVHRQLLIQGVAEHPFFYSAASEPKNPIRGAAFRREIMRIYNYTCAVCRLRVDTIDGKSITVTDAAHIIPFNESHSDDIRNGISLCKLHHWVFDRGLISVDERYRVKVSRLIDEEGPAEWRLSNLHNEAVLLPEHERLYPAQEALAWHRGNVLRQ